MNDYLALFIDSKYPKFIDKYLNTTTLKRLRHVTQFCGCDYTNLYHPKFLYTRYDHSLVVAHMTWHFTHDKKETIVALLHDIGTPCFAHSIDFVLGDSINQESSERKITDVILEDKELLQYLKQDHIILKDFEDLSKYPILENHTPRLCTDRLDGVLHTCAIWLGTHTFDELKEVYNHIEVLTNEEGNLELGFTNIQVAETFATMTAIYAKELQGNRDKYVMQFVAKVVKEAFHRKLITLDDLYHKKESELVFILKENFSSWNSFEQATQVICTNQIPNQFYISIFSKKRNVIPLVKINEKIDRITNVSNTVKNIYDEIAAYQDTRYAYVESIQKIG